MLDVESIISRRTPENRLINLTNALSWQFYAGGGGVRQTSLPDQDRNAAVVFDVVHARILRFFPELVDQLEQTPGC